MLPDRLSPDFSIRLKQICDFNNISYKDIAKEANISKTTVHVFNYKNKDKIPSERIYNAISVALENLIKKKEVELKNLRKSLRTKWLPCSPYYTAED